MFKKIIKKSFMFACVGLLLVTTVGCSQEHKYLSKVQQLMMELGLPACSDLKTCVDVTQKAWLRTAGKERWEIDSTQEDKRVAVMPYLKRLSLVDAVAPMYAEYDYAVILGATLSSVKARRDYLQECWNNGVRFKQVVCLVGQRYLDKVKEVDVLLAQGVTQENLPVTETDMMRYMLDAHPFTNGLEAVPVVIIDTPGSTAPNGMHRRPTTEDTVIAWLATNPSAGSVLAISNQPFCVYQHVVLATVLPTNVKTFSRLEVVGPKATESTIVAVYLDSLARILYQLNKSGYSALEEVMAYIPGYDQTA